MKVRKYMQDKRIQWHPAFCSAMRLELAENKDELDKEQNVWLTALTSSMTGSDAHRLVTRTNQLHRACLIHLQLNF